MPKSKPIDARLRPQQEIAQHFRPIRRGTHTMPMHLRRLAIRLSYAIGDAKTAYLFAVRRVTIRRWRDRIRL